MFIGLVIPGSFVARCRGVDHENKSPLPFSKQLPARRRLRRRKLAEPPPASPAPLRAPMPSQRNPLALPGKPGDPIPRNAQFYDILPGKSDAVPDKGAETCRQGRAEEGRREEPGGRAPGFLQASSFSTPQDADNQKAKLAFMGVEAVVQQVMVPGQTLLSRPVSVPTPRSMN